MKKVEYYHLENGHSPFEDWIDELDAKIRLRVLSYIDRLAAGGSRKNVSALGEIFELKLQFGAGWRVYFGEYKKTIIILLLGGNKSTQNSDIVKAKSYWRSYEKK